MLHHRLRLPAGLIKLCIACALTFSPAAAVAAENPAWTRFAADFVEGTFKAQPYFAVQMGRHEFDGRMPDWSRAGIEAEVRRLKNARAAATAFAAESLSAEQLFERDYVVAVTDNNLFWLAKAEFPFRNPAWYVNQLDPEVYLSREYAPLEQRLSGYIGYAKAIAKIADSIRANLRTPLPKSYVEYGISGFGGFAEFYRNDVPKVFAAIKDPALQKELAAANTAAANAMLALKDWLVTQRATANDSFALGPELYAAMVKDTEGLDMPVAAIEAAGRADLERNSAALKQACGQFAPGKSVRDCVSKVQTRKPADGPVAGARAQLATLRKFVEDKGIVSIPGTEEALVAESPPYNRQNSAYITTPGPYEKNIPFVYNISPPDPSWTPEEQADYIDGEAELLNTSVHEVWPGHFLQFLHSNRAKSRIGQLWVGYAYAEGWAHYTEELMWDMGLGSGNQENHIAQLLDALWRNVRLVSSIGLHTQGMTTDTSERMFQEYAFSDPGNARQQARRGTYDPAYLNYTLGKLMIRKLRDDWVAKQIAGKPDTDPKSYWRAFHDEFLSHGGPPIPMLRRAILGDADNGPLL
ncbi:MAG: hypothetical protein A3H91_03785 [Gammaproteobacteria bacterium RIFCSPLOWO2_02_FULL_61_13]|nr:MAG: hypothetical protein A3H91_03785 [Gammaproteobacteria bacterium RIFCSPLOWO2_02_FULL_61_13]